MDTIYIIIAVYLIAINLFAAAITAYDKHCAKKDKQRIPEKMLFITAFMGGAVLMLITMKTIRHKTLHKRFMIGIPLIILLHIAAISAAVYFIWVK